MKAFAYTDIRNGEGQNLGLRITWVGIRTFADGEIESQPDQGMLHGDPLYKHRMNTYHSGASGGKGVEYVRR